MSIQSDSSSTTEDGKMKTARLEEVVNILRRNFGEPTPTSGVIRVCSQHVNVTTKWTLSDVDMGKRISYKTISQAENSNKEPVFKMIQPAEELNESIIFTLDADSDSQLRAVAKEVSVGEKKLEYIEIWKAQIRLGVYDVDFAGLHGKISRKGEMPSVQWSPDESKLLFVAEKKVPKSESYFAKKPTPGDTIGGMFRWKEDWGEQLEGSVCPVIVVLDINEMKAEVIQKPDSSLGQAIFTADGNGVIGVERPNTPYRLGVIFCTNRLQWLFHYDLSAKSFTTISAPDKCAYCPRLDDAGKTLIYFQNEVGGPHRMTAKLLKMDWSSEKREPAVVVGIPANPKEDEFPGLYEPSLCRRCFIDDGKTVFVNSTWHSRRVVLRIDLKLGTVVNVTTDENFGAWTLFDMSDGMILASRSSPSIKAHVVVGRVGSDSVEWTTVSDPVKAPNTKWQLMKLRPENEPEHYFEAILIYGDSKEKRPLIVFPHGGPHVTSLLAYTKSAQFFVDCGYGVLFVNYRGSLGFGEVNLRSLAGRIGDSDVKDCYQATKAVDDSLVSDLVLFGGSHGGFLSAHLVGQYPATFKAAALRNPVTDLTLQSLSDIPDWCWYELGCEGNFKHDSLFSAEDLVRGSKMSPMAHAHKIVAPCFFFLGTSDVRVDKGNGLRLYKYLRARGVDARCNMYEDNHSLSNVKHESDALVASIEWFEKYVCRPHLAANSQ